MWLPHSVPAGEFWVAVPVSDAALWEGFGSAAVAESRQGLLLAPGDAGSIGK